MRRSSLIVCALLVTATFGCEQVKRQVANVKQQAANVKQEVDAARQRFFGKKPAPPVAAKPAPVRPTPAPPPPPPAPPAPPPAQSTAGRPHPVRDIPYVSEDTGTVFPGMSEKDVYSLWGAPAAVRHLGEFTYLYFKNGCEHSCGHLDVVTLQSGRVVDAIVRWPGHGFAGQATSDTAAAAAPPQGP